MSKNHNENTVAEVATMHILDAVREFNGGEEISLKAFALALDIPATRLYAIAKRPIVGRCMTPTLRTGMLSTSS